MPQRKRALQAAKAEKAERAAAAERNKLATVGKAEKAIAERKALKAKEEAAAKHKAAAEKPKKPSQYPHPEPKERIRQMPQIRKNRNSQQKVPAVREAEAKVAKAETEQTAKAEKPLLPKGRLKRQNQTAEVKSGKKPHSGWLC